jgi:methyl-accepting chemotaxis protein
VGRKVRIRTKIFALVGALSLVTIVTAGVGISTVGTYNDAVHDVNAASTRALYSERLNRLVTAVVMDSRGVYAAKEPRARSSSAKAFFRS